MISASQSLQATSPPTNERWVDTLVLDVFANELLRNRTLFREGAKYDRNSPHTLSSIRALVLGSEHSTPCWFDAEVNERFRNLVYGSHLVQELPQELVGFLGVQSLSRRESDVQLLFEFSNHVESLPRCCEVEFVFLLSLTLALRVVLDLVSTSQVLDHAGNHGLRNLHEIVHVGVRHIEFTDGEFRVVGHVDTFVSEDSSDFVDSVKTTDNELLEEKFRSDSHEEVELEVVVVSNERLGSGTTGDHVHHRCLDLCGSISNGACASFHPLTSMKPMLSKYFRT